MTTVTFADDPRFPLIANYGGIHPRDEAGGRPDNTMRYQIVFAIASASTDAAKPNASLEKVARMLNLLAHDGVEVARGDIVAIVYGKATPLILADAKYDKKNHTANPNLPLIKQLSAAGAEVHVCNEAMHAMAIEAGDIDPDVQIDASALTTLATLQLRGYALIPD
jgi:DsrE/DsrF-like family.